MVSIRMGAANRVTAERFHVIKGALAENLSDQTIMRKYGVKKTTLNYIKISKNFYEYRLRTEPLPGARKMPKIYNSYGLAYEDYRDFKPRHRAYYVSIDTRAFVTILLLGVICAIILAATLIARN